MTMFGARTETGPGSAAKTGGGAGSGEICWGDGGADLFSSWIRS